MRVIVISVRFEVNKVMRKYRNIATKNIKRNKSAFIDVKKNNRTNKRINDSSKCI